MELRPYQIEPVEKGIQFFKGDYEPSIEVLPTAAGKSIIIAKIAEGTEGKMIIICPSKELLQQNYDKYIALGGHAGIYSASFGKKEIQNVTFATIQSIYKKGMTFFAMGFTKMCVDEIHLFPRNSDSMIGRFLKESGIKKVLGFTATALKLQTNYDFSGNQYSKLQMLTSKSKNGQFFKEIIHVTQIKELVESGFWSKLIYEEDKVDTSGLQFNSTKSDFTELSLASVYAGNNLNEKIINRISQLDRKSIVVFVPFVAHAKLLASLTPNSVAVYGDMDTQERDNAIRGFKSGQIRIAYNVNIMATGFDHPQLDCIILARPTASLSLYYQQIGRGTRIHPDKKDCLIIDYSGNVDKFGPVEELYYKKENTWKLYGKNGRLLSGIPLDQIGKHTETNQGPIMPWGRHRGMPIKSLPVDYKTWLLGNISWDENNNWIKTELLNFNTQTL